jgi:hypothetical protein
MAQTLEIPILGKGIAGKSLAVDAQLRKNLYLEITASSDKTEVVAYGTPGTSLFSQFGAQPVRGIWWMQAKNLLFVVAGATLYEISLDGTATQRGTLAQTVQFASMSDNGAQLIIVQGANGYIYQPTTPTLAYTVAGTTVTVTETSTNRSNGDVVSILVSSGGLAAGNYTISGAATNSWQITSAVSGVSPGNLTIVDNFRQITAAGFPGGSTVVFQDSYFIVNRPGTQQFFLSGQFDGFTWDALQFASKEANPDNLLAVSVDHGNLVLLGEVSSDYWQDVGGFPFPYLRMPGTPNDVGIAAVFSLAHCGDHLMFLARTRRGGISVVMMQNFMPIVVSTPDLDSLFFQYTGIGNATAFSYRQNGHDFYQINFSEQGATWLYDATSDAWSSLVSFGMTGHIGQFGSQFQYQNIISDINTGNLYILDPLVYTDNGQTIIRELVTPHFFQGNSFNKLHVYRLRLDMELGVGLTTGQGQNPQVMLNVSRDGGFTWGNALTTSFGAQGQFLKRAEWRRLGVSRNYVYKFTISDPVKVVMISAAAYATEAQK